MKETNETKERTVTIFSQRLAGLLMLKGFVLVGVGENKYHENRTVFFFNNTDEVQKVIDDFKTNKNKYFI